MVNFLLFWKTVYRIGLENLIKNGGTYRNMYSGNEPQRMIHFIRVWCIHVENLHLQWIDKSYYLMSPLARTCSTSPIFLQKKNQISLWNFHRWFQILQYSVDLTRIYNVVSSISSYIIIIFLSLEFHSLSPQN